MKFFDIYKRALDMLAAAAAVIVLSALPAVICIGVELSSEGVAILRQERPGRQGKPSVFCDLRTMKQYSEPSGPSPKGGQDPRPTKAGRLVRRYFVDELPRLFDVLVADTSVVGPRPLYVSQIPECNERQKKRLPAEPGLTGPAQISGGAGLAREEKLDIDVKYTETASLITDIKIILLTISCVFNRKNICEKRYSKTEYNRSSAAART
jgi:lipopolysaccharide/colanic/teichoic acid biosynthesis glycosyltransferase